MRVGTAREPRSHYLPKIRKLLAAGPTSLETIATALDLRKDVTGTYLHHMHHDLREIRKSTRLVGADLWELGEDLTLPSDEIRTSQNTVPARQVGMPRDPLVAAMFGPARGVEAC
jgi:hypothetical protein